MIMLAAIVLQSHLVMMVADRVPAVDIAKTCRIEAGSAEQDYAACVTDEETARGQLTEQWTTFSATDKGNCVQSTTGRYLPSYVELITCLEMYAFTKRPAHPKSPRRT